MYSDRQMFYMNSVEFEYKTKWLVMWRLCL